jgi:AraC-like DNA-binding protein
MGQTVQNYSIKDIIHYRELSWSESEEFLFLTKVPEKFEPFFVNPTYYCVGMITQGKLEIDISNVSHNLSPNSLMVYRPGQIFKVTDIGENTSGAFVLFTKKFLDNLNENIFSVKSHSFLSQGIKSFIELADHDKEKILNTFKGIFALLSHLSTSNWELIARNLTSALIYEIDDILNAYIDHTNIIINKDEELFYRFNHLIIDHFKTNRDLAFYAAKLCVSSNYLYAAVKKISGSSPSVLINHRVISEARYLVSYTVKTFGEIAYHLNFSDPFTFSKYFKKHTGYSPLQYRKSDML